jgi:threonine dehydrogenase-like Zn-dependent dehydrogenase
MHAAGDVRIEDVPDAAIVEPTDAVMRVTDACICGSDLWPYTSMEHSDTGQSMGHEAIGVVEDVGSQVTTIKKGDLVVMPFAYSDGTCAFCHEGLPTACVHVGFFGNITIGGGPAPVRAYLDELLPDVLEGRIDPGRVLDRTVGLDSVPDGYRAMADRDAIKVMVTP